MARESKKKRNEKRFGKEERLADIILGGNSRILKMPEGMETTDYDPMLLEVELEAINRSVHICCQNVYGYASQHFGNNPIDFCEDVPYWKLPFSPTFFEFNGLGDQHGTLAIESKPKESEGRVVYLVHYVRCPYKSNHVFVFGRTRVPTDNVGFPVKGEIESEIFSPSEENVDKIHGIVGMATAICGLAVSFMNCKNVSIVAAERNAEFDRKREQAKLHPFVRYNTINIEPMKETLRTEGGVEINGFKKALHICRGHFARYSDTMFGRKLEKPVMVWRNPHTRGSIKKGMILSDYNVNAPATAS